MSLLQRQKRPIRRDAKTLRDDRIFFIACDDTHAPKQYFEFFRIARIQIHVVPTVDGGSVAARVLKRLESFEHEDDDERWMLLDTDHCTSGTHLGGFRTALREARSKGIQVALSKPCFEVWLLLHHLEDLQQLEALKSAKDVDELLRKILGEYNKTRLKAMHFPLDAVRQAIIRSKDWDGSVDGGDIPSAATTRVHRLWQAILSKALPSQIPEELKGL